MNPDQSERVTSEEFATQLGISVRSLYKLRTQAKNQGEPFPNPIGFAGRTSLYAAREVDDYVRLRQQKTQGRGRRARVSTEQNDSFSARLRAAILHGAGAPRIPTQAALAAELELSTVTFGNRMRGKTRWKPTELETIHELLGIDTSDANDPRPPANTEGMKPSRG